MDGSSDMSIAKNLVLLTLFFVLIQNFAQAGGDHNKMFLKNWKLIGTIQTENFQKTFKKVSDMDIDIAGVDIKNNLIDLLLSDHDYNHLVKEGFEVSISEVKGVTRGPDEEYKNPEEIEFLITEYARQYPGLTHMISIGKSLEGRDIWALKISDNAKKDEFNEPAVLFNSMHHAREIMTPEVSIDIIDYLLTNYSTDQKVAEWVDNTEIWVIPMFNVDGNNKMWTYDKWWRKNTRGGYGVDLNRNYPTGWNKCNGSSGSRRSQTYRGPNPASEPETQAMMNFISSVRPVFDISYHAYSELVIYPYGCSPERTPNKNVVEKIGKEIAQKLNYKAGTAWELLYNADGGDIDWMYEAYQVIPYVIELNSRKQGFHPSYSKWRDKTVQRNRVGWQHLLERVQKSGIRGEFSIDNAFISDYVIQVFDAETDSFIMNYKGHKRSGMYHLVLNPGTYRLKFIVNKNIVSEEEITINQKLETFDIRL